MTSDRAAPPPTPAMPAPSPQAIAYRAVFDGIAARASAAEHLSIGALVRGEPGRRAQFTLEAAGLHLDLTRAQMTVDDLTALFELARAADVTAHRDAMMRGATVNATEGRPALQAGRLDAAIRLAARLRAAVVIKGAGSVVASPDGDWSVNDSGGPALATGGTGDVLAGVVASLIAQGHPTVDALRLGVWLHGHAGDLWQAHHGGTTGMSAAELPHWLVAASAC